MNRLVVVGASLAGLRAAQAARAAGFDGELVVIGDEPHMPYTRPPLSKELLAGEETRARVPVRASTPSGGSARPRDRARRASAGRTVTDGEARSRTTG